MKLSELLEKYRIEEKFEVKNEKNFDTLALTQSDICLLYTSSVVLLQR